MIILLNSQESLIVFYLLDLGYNFLKLKTASSDSLDYLFWICRYVIFLVFY